MLADKLRELRALKGLSREAAAEKIGISTRALANYERGERIPQGEILISIADFYGVDRDELLFDSLSERNKSERTDESSTVGGQAPAAAEAKSSKVKALLPWLIAGVIVILLVIADLVFFIIENIPVENGDSALDITVDWRNVALAVAAVIFFAAALTGGAFAIRYRRQRLAKGLFAAVALLAAGATGFGVTFGIICSDCFFTAAERRRGFATYIRLDIQGDYDGNISAQATNNFNIGYDRVEVTLTLYYSEEDSGDVSQMTLIESAACDDLDIFKRLYFSAPAKDGYWRACVVYKTNGGGWTRLQTESVRYNSSAVIAEE